MTNTHRMKKELDERKEIYPLDAILDVRADTHIRI